MSLLEAVVQALVQGWTEFLPISSSGQLIAVRRAFGWDDPGVEFDIAVHLGTLGAILFHYRREVWLTVSGAPSNRHLIDGMRPRRLLQLGFFGTVPLVAAGAAVYALTEDQLRDPTLTGAMLLVTALLIILAEFLLRRRRRPLPLVDLSLPRAFLIGCAQACALIPGISRSGSVMVAAMALGHSRPAATRWAFWLSIPALSGAGLLAVVGLLSEREPVGTLPLLIGAAVSFAIGLVAIRFLLWLVSGRSLLVFSLQCTAVGVALILLEVFAG